MQDGKYNSKMFGLYIDNEVHINCNNKKEKQCLFGLVTVLLYLKTRCRSRMTEKMVHKSSQTYPEILWKFRTNIQRNLIFISIDFENSRFNSRVCFVTLNCTRYIPPLYYFITHSF